MKRTGLKKYEYADVEHFTSKPGLRIRKIMNKSWHIFLKLGTTRKIHIVDYPQLQKGKNYIFASDCRQSSLTGRSFSCVMTAKIMYLQAYKK